jgi:hypothetical protein
MAGGGSSKWRAVGAPMAGLRPKIGEKYRNFQLGNGSRGEKAGYFRGIRVVLLTNRAKTP